MVSLKYTNWYLKVKDRMRWLACGLPPVNGEVTILDTTKSITVTLPQAPPPGSVFQIIHTNPPGQDFEVILDSQKLTRKELFDSVVVTGL